MLIVIKIVQKLKIATIKMTSVIRGTAKGEGKFLKIKVS